MSTTRQRHRWARYQVDGERYRQLTHPGALNPYTTTKTVAALTEAEAKDELCAAMDLIEKLNGHALAAIGDAQAVRYLPSNLAL